MPARQLWAFLTENDLRELIGQIAAREPGLTVSQGRYMRGDPRALLGDPASLERRESLPGERRIYLLHRKYSADIVAHLQPAGPFAGWSQIDEEKTDCIVVRLKETPAGQLGQRGSMPTSPGGGPRTRCARGPCSRSGRARRSNGSPRDSLR